MGASIQIRWELIKKIAKGIFMPSILTTDRTTLYVKDWGAGQPVILIHGWPLSSDSWDDQAMALAQAGYRVIAYDRRGFGRSTQPWSGYDYDTLADDLANVIEQTGAKDAVIVGFSMGGGEVARYMSRHKGKSVAKAVLVSASLPYRLKTSDNPLGIEQAGFDQMMQALNDDRPQFLTSFFQKFFGTSTDSQAVSQALLEWARSAYPCKPV
jgi:pimeloyl-ACP methyl ester carboxylesterase